MGWDWAFERQVPFGRRKSSQCLLPQEFQKLETLEMVGRAWALGITQLAGDAPPELWDQGQVFISALFSHLSDENDPPGGVIVKIK